MLESLTYESRKRLSPARKVNVPLRYLEHSSLLTLTSVCLCLLINHLALIQAQAQSTPSLTVKSWSQSLNQHAERINEAPTPPPQYLRSKWRWEEHQELREGQSTASRKSVSPIPLDDQASLLYRLQKNLWDRLGQASHTPLYESPLTRDQRSAQMDLETRGTPVLPTYTHEFIPSVYPHKRMTSWNVISDEGHLEVDIGGLTEIESIPLPQAQICIEGDGSLFPTSEHYLSMGENIWLTPQQLDLECLRDECLRRGASCFLGVFSTAQWRHYTQPRGVASVSPEQSLITLNTRSAVIMSQDDAGNFYLSASPDAGLSRLEQLAVVVSAPRSYFSGAWRSSLPLSALEGNSYLQLPQAMKRQALFLSAQVLELSPTQRFESMIFKLADYFRSFIPGDSHTLDNTVYQTLMLSQIGVCRHRSYAFMITARALGIPTRYVTNQVHAFVEILDPSGRWRRIDLGGEGIAPEDKHLTDSIRSQNAHERGEPYRPDDGLPRPAPYQSIAESSSVIRDAIRDTFESPPVDRSVQTRSEGNSLVNDQDTALSNQQEKSSSKDLKPKEVSSQDIIEKKLSLQTPKKDHPLVSSTTSNNPVSAEFSTHKTVHNICPHSAEDDALLQSRPKEHQKIILRDLRRLLAVPRNELTEGSSTRVILRDPKINRLHRCELIELRGRVKNTRHRYQKHQSKLKGGWVMAAIKSKVDGRILDGWSRLDHRGFFRFHAQVPSDVSPGDYQVLVYFPAQKGIKAGWSEVE